MADILPITQIGELVLRRFARTLSPAEILSPAIQKLIADMRETMYQAPGVGLAAPQVGYGLQLAVLEDRPEYIKNYPAQELAEKERAIVPFQVIINPVLTIEDAEEAAFFEGCLSIPPLMGIVPRARAVKVECLNERAESVVIRARGWHARILQHEIDHLHGTLCIDRAYQQTLMTKENYAERWQHKPVGKILAAFAVTGSPTKPD